MKTPVRTFDSIAACNRHFACTTLHPQVTAITLPPEACTGFIRLNFYSVWMKPCTCLGWKPYDFSSATLSFLPPNRLINANLWGSCCKKEQTRLLGFHPEVLGRATAEEMLTDFSFFNYRPNEALHISSREKATANTCLDSLEEELQWGVDEYSHTLLRDRITLFLHCAKRFYKRQFITRHDVNLEMLAEAYHLLDNYFLSGQARQKGLPDADYLGRMLGLSPTYFEDLLLHETGKTVEELIWQKRIELAYAKLRRTDKSVSCIAEELGFPSTLHFCHLFKRTAGCSPLEFRHPN